MRILPRGRTNGTFWCNAHGFVLLRSLLLTVSLLLVVSVMLTAFAAVIKQSGIIERQAERIIAARNAASYQEFDARQ